MIGTSTPRRWISARVSEGISPGTIASLGGSVLSLTSSRANSGSPAYSSTTCSCTASSVITNSLLHIHNSRTLEQPILQMLQAPQSFFVFVFLILDRIPPAKLPDGKAHEDSRLIFQVNACR